MVDLNKMKKEWKNLKESSKEQYASGSVGALSQDSNSKEVKPVGRAEGSKVGRGETGDGGAAFEKSKGAAGDGVKPVGRKEGSAAGKGETGEGGEAYEKSKGKPSDVVKPVGRQEGASAGKGEVGEYGDLASFRERIRSQLGLNIPSGINEPNKGLNESKKKKLNRRNRNVREGNENVPWMVEIDDDGDTNQLSFTDIEEAKKYFLEELNMFLDYLGVDGVERKNIVNIALKTGNFEDTNNDYSISIKVAKIKGLNESKKLNRRTVKENTSGRVFIVTDGANLFGFFDNRDLAEKSIQKLQKEHGEGFYIEEVPLGSVVHIELED